MAVLWVLRLTTNCLTGHRSARAIRCDRLRALRMCRRSRQLASASPRARVRFARAIEPAPPPPRKCNKSCRGQSTGARRKGNFTCSPTIPRAKIGARIGQQNERRSLFKCPNFDEKEAHLWSVNNLARCRARLLGVGVNATSAGVPFVKEHKKKTTSRRDVNELTHSQWR